MSVPGGGHLEIHLETEIAEYLHAHGWEYSTTDAGYDRVLALFPEDVFTWLETTQPDEYAKVVRPQDDAAKQQRARDGLLKRLTQALDADPASSGGTLRALRDGFQYAVPSGGTARFRMAQFRPNTSLTPEAVEQYDAMRLRVIRQVHYSVRTPAKSLDLVFFVNGLPVATVEVKTDFTQSVDHAVRQFKFDRAHAGEPLFAHGKRALVHFAVSNSEVRMTTKLNGPKTSFLPFNRGNGDGAGNPPNPGGSASSYFWEETLQKDTWLRMFQSFVSYLVESDTDPDTGRKTLTPKVLFPRYHQWRAVTRLIDAARIEGPGHRYLVQHSAGSGKTNSIAWLAHQLSQLHDDVNERVFDTIVVVTDRTVLDKQLQDAIQQFERHKGTVASITRESGESKSAELSAALAGGKNIVIVTIQTFEALINVIQTVPELQGRKFAVIADEAHSSQTGSTAGALTKVLSPSELADGAEISSEDHLRWAMEVTAEAVNISFFAFTATPKNKTMELFGRIPEGGDTPKPFDVYTMRQAIEEGFILDVLNNYIPYKVAWELQHPGADYDGASDVDESTAVKALVKYVRLHPTNISQKAKIVVDHFREFVSPLLEGKAKAMVVTGSRVEAVRWKKYLDAYVADNRITGVKSLVAFSGTVDDLDDVGVGLTEATQNRGAGADLAEVFKGPVYNVMIVAEKFQTGFDQPRLIAMYVDRKLGGVQAVQTLSRLNRMYPGKDKTFVLDFVNEPDDVLEAFKPYFLEAELTDVTDPNQIFELTSKLDSSGIYLLDEVRETFDAALAAGHRVNSRLSAAIRPAVDRFSSRWFEAVTNADASEQEALKLVKRDMNAFVKLYDFLSQIRNFEDPDLPRRHYFFRRILPQLHTSTYEEPIDLSQVSLSEYRITRGEKADLKLEGGSLTPIAAVGSGLVHEKHRSALEEIIAKLNERFGGQYGDGAVGPVVDHVMSKLAVDVELQAQARANSPQQFAESPDIEHRFANALMEVREETPQIINEIVSDADIFRMLSRELPTMLYELLRNANA